MQEISKEIVIEELGLKKFDSSYYRAQHFNLYRDGIQFVDDGFLTAIKFDYNFIRCLNYIVENPAEFFNQTGE